MKRDEAIHEMATLHERASAEERIFTDEEQARFAELKLMATAEKEPEMEATIEQPVGALRAVAGAGAVRTLTDAFIADGNVVERMVQNGRARIEVPINVRALGSDQALSPAPGLAVPPQFLAPFSGYYGIFGRLLDALKRAGDRHQRDHLQPADVHDRWRGWQQSREGAGACSKARVDSRHH